MKKVFRKILAISVFGLFLFSLPLTSLAWQQTDLPPVNKAAQPATDTQTQAITSANIENTASASPVSKTGINVDVPTFSQIRDFVKKHPIILDLTANVEFDKEPSLKAPYSVGKVKDKYLQDGLNAANIARYISGLPANLVLDAEYTDEIQHGAVFLAVNHKLEHTPSQSEKPKDMSQQFFNKAYEGTAQSNLGLNFNTLSDSVINGYMYDGDPFNINRVGHRRWILNPPLGKTGFGFADTQGQYSSEEWSGMYVMDYTYDSKSKYDVVAYPAQNMPVEYVYYVTPYSLSLSSEFDYLYLENITVKMTRLGDGKVWNFSSKENADFFWVNNTYYGQPHCIIWKPVGIEQYKSGDRFSIVINGVTKNGTSYPIRYNVNYFSLDPNVPLPQTPPTAPATPASFAASPYSCTALQLKWKASNGAAGYEIYGSNTKTGKFSLLKKTSSLSYIHSKLTTGKPYYYRIRAFVTSGGKYYYSTFSPIVSAKPAPAAPASVKIKKASNNSIKVSWSKVNGATKFELCRATSANGKFSTIAVTSSLSYVNSKLKKGKYYYKVRAYRIVNGKKIYGSYSKTVSLSL